MPKIAEILNDAARRLAVAGVAEPRREAASLLAFALGRDRTFLITHDDFVPAEAAARAFEGFLARRARREPLQYITGRQEFYGLEFRVTPDVLIPRPETEAIVEEALAILPDGAAARFCEIGVGSGCISVAILRNAPHVSAVGLDVSAAALAVAAENAARHGVADRLALAESDVFAALEAGAGGGAEKFALVVSNPPYIPLAEMAGLQAEVRDFEPRGALTDGAGGLSIVARIVAGAPRFLAPGGRLLLEIGFGQADETAALFDRARWPEVAILPDLQGIPRTVRARLK